ncbi:MAG: hypothetical protein CMJ83_09180 [Planctomycetes bacterium]|nr:hypothetical protein [Planctomycetota bacterium]
MAASPAGSPYPSIVRKALPAQHVPDQTILELAHEMIVPPDQDDNTFDEARDNPEFAAGYTYFGQFIAHDLTLFEQRPLLKNRRTAAFDLDSVYGGGPTSAPWLYTRGPDRFEFLLGTARDRFPDRTSSEPDLPRNAHGIAIIPDVRNDENVLTSQIHVGFMRAHNRIQRDLARTTELVGLELFQTAARELCWTYQYLVLNDFLPRILDELHREALEKELSKLTAKPSKSKRSSPPQSIAKEFVLAAFRFGHSIVRPGYRLNGDLHFRPLLPVDFRRSARDGHLAGGDFLPTRWAVDWSMFLTRDEPRKEIPDPGGRVQVARLIDRRLSGAMGQIPPIPPMAPFAREMRHDERLLRNLPLRTLKRGRDHKLPSGETLAAELGVPSHTPSRKGLPLWPYLLDEAFEQSGGRTLGCLGSCIVLDTCLKILSKDASSFLRANPEFIPTVGGRDRKELRLIDLLQPGFE